MKLKMTLLAFLAFAMQASAQQRNDYIGIALGGATPVGAFGNTNDGYLKSGYATGGASFEINYIHRFNDWFGLCIRDLGVANGINQDKVAEQTGGVVSLDHASSAGCLLVGGFFKDRHFPIFGRAQVGFGTVRTAGFHFYDGSFRYVVYKQSDGVTGFAYSLGGGAMWPLGSRWAFSVSVDFVSCLAKPSVSGYVNVNAYGSFSAGAVSYGQNVINGQVGIGYLFGSGGSGQKKAWNSKGRARR